jgi:hypothetical protein
MIDKRHYRADLLPSAQDAAGAAASAKTAISPTANEESGEDLLARAADRTITEEMALALLGRGDLSGEALEALGKNATVSKSRKVRLAVIGHARTPRHVSLAILRHLFTFELMTVALMPAVPGDVKKAADDALIVRLESVSLGEKLSLARRASGAVAGALLLERDCRVIRAALNNSRLTEAHVVRALVPGAAQAGLAEAVCHHEKWSLRGEVQVALLRNQHTPLAKALALARSLPPQVAVEVLEGSQLPEEKKSYLLQELKMTSSD